MKKFTLFLFAIAFSAMSFAQNYAIAGGDFENWSTFTGGLNSFGLKSYATQGVGKGYNGSNSLNITGNPTGNDYVFTSFAPSSFPAGAITAITFWVKGTSDAKSLSVNLYKADATYYCFNLGNLATTDVTITSSGSNSYTGTINTNGNWVKVTLDLTGITDYSTSTSASFFALKVGKSSNYALDIDNIEFVSQPAGAVRTPTITPSGQTSVYTSSQNVSISSYGADTTIYYTTDGNDPTTLSSVYSAPFTINSSCTVKAIAVAGTSGNTSSVASATYTFVPVTDVANIAAFLAANSATNTTPYRITGTVTVTYQNGASTYVQDGTGDLIIHGSTGQTLTNGQTLTGLIGTYTLYVNPIGGTAGVNELIPLSVPTAETGTAISPAEMTISQITTSDQAKYVKLKGVSFDADYSSTGNVNLTDGTNKLALYNSFSTLSGNFSASKTYDVTGMLTVYNNAPEIYPISVDETSGISNTTATSASVIGETGYILATLTAAEPISVYSLLGVKIASIKGSEGTNVINLPKGLYIVTIGTKTAKVLVK